MFVDHNYSEKTDKVWQRNGGRRGEGERKEKMQDISNVLPNSVNVSQLPRHSDHKLRSSDHKPRRIPEMSHSPTFLIFNRRYTSLNFSSKMPVESVHLSLCQWTAS